MYQHYDRGKPRDDRPPMAASLPPLPPRKRREARLSEADEAAAEDGYRYRRAHLRRLGAIAAATWTIAGLMLLGFVIGLLAGLDAFIRGAA